MHKLSYPPLIYLGFETVVDIICHCQISSLLYFLFVFFLACLFCLDDSRRLSLTTKVLFSSIFILFVSNPPNSAHQQSRTWRQLTIDLAVANNELSNFSSEISYTKISPNQQSIRAIYAVMPARLGMHI